MAGPAAGSWRLGRGSPATATNRGGIRLAGRRRGSRSPHPRRHATAACCVDPVALTPTSGTGRQSPGSTAMTTRGRSSTVPGTAACPHDRPRKAPPRWQPERQRGGATRQRPFSREQDAFV